MLDGFTSIQPPIYMNLSLDKKKHDSPLCYAYPSYHPKKRLTCSKNKIKKHPLIVVGFLTLPMAVSPSLPSHPNFPSSYNAELIVRCFAIEAAQMW